MTVFEKIEEQQKNYENNDIWMVGEQLKDICRNDATCASIVDQDLNNKDMSIVKAAAQIKAYADKQHRKGKCVCVPPNVAEKIIREFYGLPGTSDQTPSMVESEPDFLNLADLI